MASVNRTLPRIPAAPGIGIAFLATVLLFALPVTSRADAYRDTALAFAQRMVRFFPPAEGYVVSLPAGEVYIDLTEEELMRPGMELLVYREGEDIVHPVTGDVLGKYEQKLGYLTIREVDEKYSVGTLSEGAGEVAAGDRVRISARPLPALLFFSGESPALETGAMAQVLQDAAEESKRLRLRDEPEWLPLLKELGVTIDEVLADGSSLRLLGEKAKADLIVIVTLPEEEGKSLGFEVRSLWTGRTLLEFSEPWTAPPPVAAAPSGSSSPFRIFPRREQSEPKREYVTKDLSAAGLGLVAGNFTGGGGLEVHVSDGSVMALYQWEQGGRIGKWESEGFGSWQVLNLEAGDLDGDGRDEVFVTRVRRGQLLTEVLSWDKGEWHSLGSANGVYLRPMDAGGGKTVILGQRTGVNTVFSGPVRQYAWEEDTFRTGDGITLPSNINIFGMALHDVDEDGEPEILYLGDQGTLRLLSADGAELSRTRERFGGYPARVTAEDLFGKTLVDGGYSQGMFREGITDEGTNKDVDLDIRTAFQGKLITVKDSDATLYVALPQNLSGPGKVLPNLRSFDRGKVVILRWEDGRFQEHLQSRKQDGVVSDIARGDTDGDGRDEILFTVNRLVGALLAKQGSLVVWRHTMSPDIPKEGE